jgi:histidine ammonia-lyase
MSNFIINNQTVSIDELICVIKENKKLALGEVAKKAILACRNYLDETIQSTNSPIYGINTGFGSLCNTSISTSDLAELQRNLVLSHACGMGERVPTIIVKRMLLLKILGLSKGYSGVQLQTIERLIYFYNNDVYPVVYQLGSLGASGDLAPLAHLSLPIIGEGEIEVNGSVIPTANFYSDKNLESISLQSKEGLALLNGTQFMSAYALYATEQAVKLYNSTLMVASLSLEAFNARLSPFQENVNAIRNQKGQIEVAEKIRSILHDSKLMKGEKKSVQDPYSFRCIPQVHGATLDTINFAIDIVEREINAVTDNPTIFIEENEVVSAGNFHGQPLALAMDYLCIALAELGSISERRTYKLISGTRDLPSFLIENPGLNSGFMIAHYTCASIVSQNKQLCFPASVDSIDSSNGQEDHVSMGANAATKLFRLVNNVWRIVGIEMITASQAINFRKLEEMSSKTSSFFLEFREAVPYIVKDCYLSPYLIKSENWVRNYTDF